MARKPLVYLAGPYRSDPVAGTRQAVDTALGLWETGLVAVLVPHLTLLADLIAPRPTETWLAFDLDQLAHADLLLRIPGDSEGADLEVLEATRLGIPVFHTATALFDHLRSTSP